MRKKFEIFFAILVIASTSAAWDIGKFDRDASKWINERLKSNFSDIYFSAVSYAGNSWNYLGLDVCLLAYGDSKMRDAAKLDVAAFIMSMTTVQILKCIVGRERPGEESTPRCRSSFPSGHSASAFAFAYVFGDQYPKARIPFYIFAFSVALSRIYLEKHYPTDVVVGSLIGTLGGMIVVENKHFFLSLGLKR